MTSNITYALENCQCERDSTEGGRPFTNDANCAHCCDECMHEICEKHVQVLECSRPGCDVPPTVFTEDEACCSSHAVDDAFENREEWWPEWEALAGSDAGEGVAAVLNVASVAWRNEYESQGGLNLEGLELVSDDI